MFIFDLVSGLFESGVEGFSDFRLVGAGVEIIRIAAKFHIMAVKKVISLANGFSILAALSTVD